MSNLVNRAGGNGADNSMGGEGTDLGSEAEKAVESARASGQGYGKSGAAGPAEVTDEVAEVTGNRYYTGVFCATFSGHFSKGHFIVDR